MNQKAKQNILVAGAGAIGSLFGARLSQTGHDVTLIDGWYDHVRAINKKGLLFTDPDHQERIAVKALHLDHLGEISRPPQILLLAVKSYDTEPMLKVLAPLMNRNTWVVSCQNGINEAAIAAAAGWHQTLGCVISFGAKLEGPGRVRQLRRNGLLIIGQYDGVTDKARMLLPVISAIASTQVTDNLLGHRWSKLALNCMGNPLLAVSGYTGQNMHQDRTARRVIVKIAAEIIQTAEAHGIRIEPIAGLHPALWKDATAYLSPEVEKVLDDCGRKIGGARSSMVYDIKAGRPTEIDFLNGYVVRMAEKAGLKVPANAATVALFRKLANGEINPDPIHLSSIPT
jgi:2-dehydropantoate 2-reductase